MPWELLALLFQAAFNHSEPLVLLLGDSELMKKILYSSRTMTCCLKRLPRPFLTLAEIRK